MARTPQEVFAHHAEVLIAGDLEGIVSDYADDAVFITPDGVRRGQGRRARGLREAARGRPVGRVGRADADLRGRPTVHQWSADSEKTRVEDGIDTFIFRDGEIVAQTVRYTLQQK